MDQERDVFRQMSLSQDAIAPKHIAKHTIEDDIGMVHELTQVCMGVFFILVNSQNIANLTTSYINPQPSRLMTVFVF